MTGLQLQSSARGATYLILLQVGTRAVTFGLNQLLLRYMSPGLLGAASQLELYSISVLYFARESLRVALQRQTDTTQAAVNISYISLALGFPLTLGFGSLYLRKTTIESPHLSQAVLLYGLAAMVELTAEPSFVAVQRNSLYGIRAGAETMATISRCLFTVGSVIWASKRGINLGVLPFAIGQLAYSSALFLTYTTRLRSRVRDFSLLPRKLNSGKRKAQYLLSYFSRPICRLSVSLMLQSSMKYILTQGDGILIASLASLEDQGVYALASNYGSLVARMGFQPIEESSRSFFAKLCAVIPTGKKPVKSNLMQAKKTLEDILKMYGIIAIVAVVLGPTVAPLLLRLIAGSRWASTGAGEVLSSYCYYIPLLALNGVTEAFVAAVANNSQLHLQSVSMGMFFAIFASSAFLTLRIWNLGARGLIIANGVNMLLRIVWNFWFIDRFFRSNGTTLDTSRMLPKAGSVALATTIPAMLKWANGVFQCTVLLDEFKGAGFVGIVFGLGLMFFEREYFVQCYRIFGPKAKLKQNLKSPLTKIRE